MPHEQISREPQNGKTGNFLYNLRRRYHHGLLRYGRPGQEYARRADRRYFNIFRLTSISAGDGYTVGLKSDGTVVAAGENDYDQCDVDGWTDIIAISVGQTHTVGLKKDGTAVAAGWGRGPGGRCDVDGWTDIAAVSAGLHCTFGLKTDGTAVMAGKIEETEKALL